MAIDPQMEARNWFVGTSTTDLGAARWPAVRRGSRRMETIRQERWGGRSATTNVALLAGVVLMAVSFALFANRTGLVANAIGWPVLSVALAFLVFCRGRARGPA